MNPSSETPPVRLVAQLRGARRIAVLTGAGMSAESGIPTFRDKLTGLWARFDAQSLATPEAFARDPDTVWAWYASRRRQVSEALPNPGHLALAAMAGMPQFEDFTVVTQNVDDLHERAGSRQVIHLHGSLLAARCFACGKPHALAPPVTHADDEGKLAPPRCVHCGNAVRPGVVWFGEALPELAWQQAMACVARADLMLVVGTSGQVYPAASLPERAQREGCEVAVINPDGETGEHRRFMHWPAAAGVGLPALLRALS